MSNWIDIKVSLPTEPGTYRVTRQWNDGILVESECFFDGSDFEDSAVLIEIIGEIKQWSKKDRDVRMADHISQLQNETD